MFCDVEGVMKSDQVLTKAEMTKGKGLVKCQRLQYHTPATLLMRRVCWAPFTVYRVLCTTSSNLCSLSVRPGISRCGP